MCIAVAQWCAKSKWWRIDLKRKYFLIATFRHIFWFFFHTFTIPKVILKDLKVVEWCFFFPFLRASANLCWHIIFGYYLQFYWTQPEDSYIQMLILYKYFHTGVYLYTHRYSSLLIYLITFDEVRMGKKVIRGNIFFSVSVCLSPKHWPRR